MARIYRVGICSKNPGAMWNNVYVVITVICFFMLAVATTEMGSEWIQLAVGVKSDQQVEILTSERKPNLDATMSTVPIALPPDGHPRGLIVSPCSGSSATIQFTKRILQAHGYNVSHGGQPILHKPKKILDVAKERLQTKMKKDQEPTLSETLGETFQVFNERATKNGKIFLFKIHYLFDDEITESLEQLGTKFALSYRNNVLDRAICASRDCFAQGTLGHQVYTNGTRADTCFDRRNINNETFLANFNDTKSLLSKMRKWASEDVALKNEYKRFYDPGEAVAYEDLFEFEYTDSDEVFQQSIQAWSRFLRGLADINIPILENVLIKHKNSLQATPPYHEVIYNFDEVKAAIEGSEFEHFFSQNARV